MSEYQYYEFQAIDRPLDEADRGALRALSTRATITATSFTNHYEWGDFKGNSLNLMERWFDLHLYLANWGTHRLMMRLPRRLFDSSRLEAFLRDVAWVEIKESGDNLILDIVRDDMEPDDDWDDGSGWLAAIAPLRADVLGGDRRLFYLLWLTAVEEEAVAADEMEPLPGIAPLTGALAAFADFFRLDADLVAAAAERGAGTDTEPASAADIHKIVATLPDQQKTDLLARLAGGDAHVAAELRALVRDRLARDNPPPAIARRSVGELRRRADEIRLARERAQAERLAAEQKRRAEEEEKARRARLDALARRGEDVWREIETEIERRNASGYDKAAGLLCDLKTMAEEGGTTDDFARRLARLRNCHARKQRFVERLEGLG